MGSGASKYGSVEDALADGKTQEEIDEYLNNITDTIVKLPTIKTTTGEETNIEKLLDADFENIIVKSQ